MFAHNVLIHSLLLPYLVYSGSIYNAGKYLISDSKYSRSNAKLWCEGEGATLATIESETDQHDARIHACLHSIDDGCWIGLSLPSSPTPGPYKWDDPNAQFTIYGFINSNPSDPDKGVNPWFDGEPSDNQQCVRFEADLYQQPTPTPHPTKQLGVPTTTPTTPTPTPTDINAIWADSDCGAQRRAMCNVPTPEVVLWYFAMTDTTDADEWISNDGKAEQPISTNPDRCEYRVDGSSDGNIDGSIILDDGCWAICGHEGNGGNGGFANGNGNGNGNGDEYSSMLTHYSSTYKYHQCQLQFNIDPWLESNKRCKIEITYNAGPGAIWQEIGEYDDEDAQTEFIDLPHDYSNAFDFGVRFVAPYYYDDSCCYFNHVYLRCNTICTDHGDECSDDCECCEDDDVCRTVIDDDKPTCQDCLGIAQISPQCQYTSECCNGGKDKGIVCGIDGHCCITADFGECSGNQDCCEDLRCDPADNKCKRCIDITEGETCITNSDCCSYAGPFGVVCGANNRCCKSKGFGCSENDDCCDGLICNDKKKCDCEQCKNVSVSSHNTDLCSSSSECCGWDTIKGIICGKKHKCCITQYFECSSSNQCCGDLLCSKHKKDKKMCVDTKKPDGGGHEHGSGIWSGDDQQTGSGAWSGGGSSIYYAKQQESVGDDRDNLDVLSDTNSKDKWIWSEYRYLYVIIAGVLFANIIVGICCYYGNKTKEKQSSYDITAVHQYVKTDINESDIEEMHQL